ncbi:MAG: winged helix-turn-helix domain-containing protein [Colwellia sp.]|nr:winged helix-turn-helix domain-containing protein [Colwellia sp.]
MDNNNKAFMVGQWKVEPGLNKISCPDNQVMLVPKVMAILLALVKGKGEPLNLETLMASVWQQQVVSDSSVYQAIAQLRKALGDTAAEPTYIQRVSGKGYRLIAQVKALPTLTNQTKTATDTQTMAARVVSQLSPSKFEKNWLANWRFWLVAIFVTVVISMLSFYKPWQAPELQTSPLSIAQINSISFQRLATENIGQSTKLDGLNDVLLTQLMQIKQMRVVSLSQKSSSPNTQAVIKGRIHKQDNNIRVFLQLVQVDSQEVIWARVFNGEINDLFALQDTIVETLLALFKRQQTLPAFKSALIDNRNFDQYLLARHLWQQRNAPALYRAKSIYEKMQQQQALFPLAAVGLCDTYHYLHIYADWSFEQALNKCRPLLQQALAQQPNLGQAIAAQAMLLNNQGKKVQAEKLFEKAIKLTPNYPFAYMWYAEMIRGMGKYKQGLSMIKTAYALAPMSPMINRSLAYAYLNAGDRAQARFYYRRALDLQRDYTNRAIEELDFLPLTIERARAFLLWAKKYPSIMRKQRSYQLTQAQIELALGKFDEVVATLANLKGQQVNPSFKLFIQTSLAAAQGRYHDVIAFIEQRIAIHQDSARYAGSYLSVLYQMGDDEKAYKAFLRLRPELARNILNPEPQGEQTVTANNRYKLIYFVQLQARRGKMKLVSDLAQQLDNSFAKRATSKNIYYARWLLFRKQKEKAKTMMLSMMNDGWLPDYSAEFSPEAIMKQLFIDVGLGDKTYQALLKRNRAQVLAGFN